MNTRKNTAGTRTAPAASPIDELRLERPDLFTAPDWWQNELKAIETAARETTRGKAEIIGKSAGGRDLWCFTYGGEFEPQNRTATISSAMGSDTPQTFYDPAKRTRPVAVLLGAIHGGETEGIATTLNLIKLLETGKDLRGRENPVTLKMVESLRLLIIPCLNPDGRERAGIRHFSGADVEHMFLAQQGLLADGTPFQGRAIKEVQPIPEGHLSFMGGYYNDDGVNLAHDDFFGAKLAPENQALRDLFTRETPDGFLSFHSHGGKISFYHANAYVSPGVHRRQTALEFYILSRLTGAGFDVQDPDRSTGPAWSFCFNTYFHHVSGALPLVCELSHGFKNHNYLSLERILEGGTTIVETWLEFAVKFGLRREAMEFFAPPPPA